MLCKLWVLLKEREGKSNVGERNEMGQREKEEGGIKIKIKHKAKTEIKPKTERGKQ